MEVDDVNIDIIKLDLINKANNNSLERQKLRAIRKDIQEITLVDQPDPTVKEPTKTKKILPNDMELGVQMTVERREARYEKIMVDVAELKT